jgi:hypothetical protein
MAYVIRDNVAGFQPIANTSTTKEHPLGTVVKAYDPTYGEGEFIYLLGVANTVVGSAVTFTASGVTALAPVGTNKPQPIAFAMSANVASQYGWYQISGLAVAYKLATICVVDGAAVAVKTVGRISKSGSGKEVSGAMCAGTASAATGRTSVTLVINRPHMQGRIT